MLTTRLPQRPWELSEEREEEVGSLWPKRPGRQSGQGMGAAGAQEACAVLPRPRPIQRIPELTVARAGR